MKLIRSIWERGDAAAREESPLGATAIFPEGTPSRHLAGRDGVPSQARSGSYGDFSKAIEALTGSGRLAGTYGPREAYALSPWMAPAIHAFAGVVAARTFCIYDGKKKLDKHPLLDLIARPNKELRMSEFELFYYSAALWRYDGEVFWQGTRDGAGPKRPGRSFLPSDLWIWNKSCVTEARSVRNHEFLGWEVWFEGMRTFVDRSDMAHFPLFDPTRHNPLGPSRGTSPWNAKRLPITNEIEAHKWNQQWWSRGIAPSFVFVNEDGTAIGEGAVAEEEFRDRLKAKLVGKNGEPLTLTGKWMIQQLEASQRDAQFIEGMAQNRDSILAGLAPPVVLGDDAANYATADAQVEAWLTFDIVPAMSFFCSKIDTTYLWDEPGLWTELSTDDIEQLQKGKGAKIDRYVSLINARHSPKVAASLAGIDVDPTMPGYDQVLVSFSQIPYDFAAEGQSVSISKADAPDPADGGDVSAVAPPPVATTPPAPIATPEPQRTVRVRVPATSAVMTRGMDTDDLLRVILEIVEKDTKRLKDRARQFQVQALQSGAAQIGQVLELDGSLLEIDNPRVVEFLEARGNLIEAVPEGVAQRIFNKTVSLIEKGTAPEDIGTLLRKDFNVLGDVHSRLIARNEVGSALNGGRHLQMVDEGVNTREWLSSRDSQVRESHEAIDGETVSGDEKYSNGCRFPQDPEADPDETIQCRCIEMPVLGGVRAARLSIMLRNLGAIEVRLAAQRGESIDERTGYWRAVTMAKDIRNIERQMKNALSGIINSWRGPILKELADRGITK
jgi:Phage portal protein/Phage Mu protein F like protein